MAGVARLPDAEQGPTMLDWLWHNVQASVRDDMRPGAPVAPGAARAQPPGDYGAETRVGGPMTYAGADIQAMIDDPSYSYRGNVLPYADLAKPEWVTPPRPQKGNPKAPPPKPYLKTRELAWPRMLLDTAKGFTDLLAATGGETGGQISPEGLLAFDTAMMGGGGGAAPRGALASGGIRRVATKAAPEAEAAAAAPARELAVPYDRTWAVGTQKKHALAGYMQEDPAEYVMIDIPIERFNEQLGKDMKLDLNDPRGGPNAIGDRLQQAKTRFQNGEYIDPPNIGWDGRNVTIGDGRHRLAAAWQLGDTMAPALVRPEDLPKVRAALFPNAGANATKAFDPAEIAVRYPQTQFPEWTWDPKKEQWFRAKNPTPEAQAVEEARRAIQADIDKGNWKYPPYFDPAKRANVDPANYPLRGNTLTDAMAKKQDTIDKWVKELDTPEARDRLMAAYNRGSVEPGAENWYAMKQLYDSFVSELGKDEGTRQFKARFADMMAATTGGSDPTANLLNAYFVNFMRQKGMPLPRSPETPYPIGGRYLQTNLDQANKLLGGQPIEAGSNPKRFNFSADFLGHTGRATIDEQMSDLIKPGMTEPPKGAYGVTEGMIADLAQRLGVDPANFQDVAWAGGKLMKQAGKKGGKAYTPKPMIQIVNEAIERTARLTNRTPDQVVADSLVRATHPLYSGGGPIGPAAGLLHEENQ